MVSPVNSQGLQSELVALLVAGALAGISVDVILYPLYTLKTLLQSEQGFTKAGGFRGVYRDTSSKSHMSLLVGWLQTELLSIWSQARRLHPNKTDLKNQIFLLCLPMKTLEATNKMNKPCTCYLH